MKKYIKKILFVFVIALLIISFSMSGVLRARALQAQPEFNKFTSSSYILMEPTSKQVLASKNEHEKMEVASIVKLMTSLLTIEALDNNQLSLDQMICASEYACSMEGSQAFLDENQSYSVKELLKSIIVGSANDSAVLLAEAVAGSENEFVKLMNAKALELKMENTLYQNATGLPAENQYSTAYDTALLINEISKHPLYEEFAGIWLDKLVHPSGRETMLVNTNRLIKYYDACKLGKTGFTDEAGYCLSSLAHKNDFSLIAVVLKCKSASDRFNESIELYNYGFNTYESAKVVTKGQQVCKALVDGGKAKMVNLVAKDDFVVLTKKSDKANISVKVDKYSIKAPVKQGDSVGQATILQDGKVIGTVSLVAQNDVAKHTFRDVLKKINQKFAFRFKNN